MGSAQATLGPCEASAACACAEPGGARTALDDVCAVWLDHR